MKIIIGLIVIIAVLTGSVVSAEPNVVVLTTLDVRVESWGGCSGTQTTLAAGDGAYAGERIWHTFLRFDLPTLAPGMTYGSAYLQIYPTGYWSWTSPDPYTTKAAFRVWTTDGSWDNNACWGTQPVKFQLATWPIVDEGDLIDTRLYGMSDLDDWVSFDVLGAMVSGATINLALDVDRDYPGTYGGGGWWFHSYEQGWGPRIEYSVVPIPLEPGGPIVDPNGDPFFPIGWWYNVEAGQEGPTIDAAFAQMAGSGANSVMVAGGPGFTKPIHDTYLFYAKKHGLRLIFQTPTWIAGRLDRGLVADDRRAIEAIATDYKHPNFLGYSLGDELLDSVPEPNVAQQQWLADQVKSWNLNTLVTQSWETTQAVADYNERLATVDGVCYARYPIGYTTPVMNYSALTQPIYQISGNAQFPQVNSKPRGLTFIGQAIGEDFYYGAQNNYYRYPTYNEQRYMTWSSAASNRLRGIWYFEFYYGSPPQAWLNFVSGVMTPMMQELRQLQQGLETGYDTGTVTTNHDADLWSGRTVHEVGTLLVKDSSNYYLILTNNMNSSAAVDVNISNLPTVLSSLTATLVNETGTGKDTIILTQVSPGVYTMSVPMSSLDVDIYRFAAAAHCSPALAADINGDCVADFADFALLASEWTQCQWSEPNQCP